jgi:hypothetical protein
MTSRPAPTRGLTRREIPLDTTAGLCKNGGSSPFRAPKIGVRHAV